MCRHFECKQKWNRGTLLVIMCKKNSLKYKNKIRTTQSSKFIKVKICCLFEVKLVDEIDGVEIVLLD